MDTSLIRKVDLEDANSQHLIHTHAALSGGPYTFCLRDIEAGEWSTPNPSDPVNCERCLLVYGAALR